MTNFPANPHLLTWARDRARQDSLALVGRFTNLSNWLEKVTA